MSKLGDVFQVDDDDGEIVSASVGNKALKSACADDATLEVDSSTGKLQVKAQGTSGSDGVGPTRLTRKVFYEFRGALGVGASAGDIIQEQNTTGATLYVVDAWLEISTGSTGACTIDIGVGSSSSTSYDNLLDGLDIQSGVTSGVASLMDSTDRGSNGNVMQKIANNEYINGSVATGTSTGLVGQYVFRAVDLS